LLVISPGSESYGEARKNRFQRLNKRFFGILRTIDLTTALFRAHAVSRGCSVVKEISNRRATGVNRQYRPWFQVSSR
jgi:hypothetical protein